jgi:quinol monooxygenase YgiN
MAAMTVFVEILPEKKKEFLQVVDSLNMRFKNVKLFKKSVVKQEKNDSYAFTLAYAWSSREEMDHFVDGEHYKLLLGALEVLGKKNEIKIEEHENNHITFIKST